MSGKAIHAIPPGTAFRDVTRRIEEVVMLEFAASLLPMREAFPAPKRASFVIVITRGDN
jgi:hypothetical protein